MNAVGKKTVKDEAGGMIKSRKYNLERINERKNRKMNFESTIKTNLKYEGKGN